MMAFGGVGPSGLGHYYCEYCFDQLTHAKSIVYPADVSIDHVYPAYTDDKITEIAQWFLY